MVALVVPDAAVWVVLGVTMTGMISFGAWLTTRMIRLAELMAGAAEKMGDHDRRLDKIEAFQSGAQWIDAAHRFEAAAAMHGGRRKEDE